LHLSAAGSPLPPTPTGGKRQQYSFQEKIGQDGSRPASSRWVLTVALVKSLQKSLMLISQQPLQPSRELNLTQQYAGTDKDRE
jgi:hypothetical protein